MVLGRINAAESATKSLADNAAALSRRADATDAALRDTNGRIEKLTAALAEVQTTARAAAAGSDRASRLAVAASALRNAVEHGDPFTAELAIVKPLAPDANAIALLEPFAASGVPGNAALGQELADDRPADAARIGRAAARRRLPRSPAGQRARSSSASARSTRSRAATTAPRSCRASSSAPSQGNIAGALTELDKLPADARAPMQAWIAKAEARNKALDASRRLAADAVAALKAAP